MDQPKFGFSLGIFEVLTPKIRKNIREAAEKYDIYALGVYTDDFVQRELNTACYKTTQQRMEIAEQLDGINFIFPVDTKDPNKAKMEIEEAYKQYLEKMVTEEKQKQKYKIGFVIGSFDVLHSGHIENIKLAKAQCEKLAAVVKSDERIKINKNKTPLQKTSERANNVRELKSIDHVFYMNLETTRKDLIEEISEYYGVDKSEVAVFLGSDLREKESRYAEEWDGINLVFTERDNEKMKVVSSSYYQKKLKEDNVDLKKLEDLEDNSYR